MALMNAAKSSLALGASTRSRVEGLEQKMATTNAARGYRRESSHDQLVDFSAMMRKKAKRAADREAEWVRRNAERQAAADDPARALARRRAQEAGNEFEGDLVEIAGIPYKKTIEDFVSDAAQFHPTLDKARVRSTGGIYRRFFFLPGGDSASY